MNKVYHYTKGYNVGNIILNKQIEAYSHSSIKMPNEKFVWLTTSENYPVSALPAIQEIPETLMLNQMIERKSVDLLNLAKLVGGIWRFEFNRRKHPEIMAWFGSYQRKKFVKQPYGMIIESSAIAVGDDITLWSIANMKLSIMDSILQQLTPKGWIDRVSFFKNQGEMNIEEIGGSNLNKIIIDSISLSRVVHG